MSENLSPDYRWQEELIVVLEGSEDGLSEQEVGEDAPGEDDEHRGHPERQRVLPGEGMRAWIIII